MTRNPSIVIFGLFVSSLSAAEGDWTRFRGPNGTGSSGEVIWRERVDGSYYGSPVCIGDRLYCISRDGEVVVVSASDRFEVLAPIPLEEPSFATPAISNGDMYLRTQSHLHSLGVP